MAHAKRHRQLIETYDRRVPAALLEAADVLLTEPGEVCQLLLSQAFFLPDPFDVPPDQLAHVHEPRSADNDPVIYQL